MSTNTDTVRVLFPATIPADRVHFVAALLTGRDDDVLLDLEQAVNGRLVPFLTDEDSWYEKVEFDAPIIPEFGLYDGTLLTDVAEGL